MLTLSPISQIFAHNYSSFIEINGDTESVTFDIVANVRIIGCFFRVSLRLCQDT